ncbi:hypothetical protein FS749_010950, partial [Ceratobasidium sp. UAMH 11750]
MGSRDKATPAVVEYAPADPNIVPAADAPLIDPDVSSDVFGITTHTNDTEAAVDGDVTGCKPWYKTPSVWWLLPITAMGALFRASTIAPRRTRILAISAAAVLITDALLFLVAFRADIIPGGYRILILGGALDGLAGGFSAVVAAGHAYVSDCSSPLARSRIFSFWTGVVYAGGALGPSLGALLNHYTNDLLSTFYVCTAGHIVYGLLVFFAVPESLSAEARAKAKEAYEADTNRHPQSVFGPLWRLTGFVRPLGVFVPKKTKGSGSWRTRDWNLTLLGVAAVGVALNTGAYHYKFQYALKTFHWNSIQLGYWLSLVGFWRAVHLTIILPLILKGLYARRERIASSNHLSEEEKEAQVKRTDLLV